LAFWTGRNAERMVILFGQSGLFRSKWQREDYRNRTIQTAIERCQNVYQPRTRKNKSATNGQPSTNGQHHHGGGEGSRALPEIVLGVDEQRVNDEVIAALGAEPHLYQRANCLVHILRDNKKKTSIERPSGTPQISLLPEPRLREMMAANVSFVDEATDKNGNVTRTSAHPPQWSVRSVAARGNWESIRHLESVVESPTVRPDGTILDNPGWDSETGLLYEPYTCFPTIPVSPSLAQCQDAAQALFRIVKDFPWAGPEHRAGWLAGVLTPAARFAFRGPSPLFAFTANCPGTGKSYLVDITSDINQGRKMTRTPYPVDDKEMAKIITSIAIAGDRMTLLDNIDQTTPFGCASLDAALTGCSWKNRILGVSQMTRELPLLTVWYASGNNITFRGDVTRRVIPIRLETALENPETRDDFEIKNLMQYVHEHRAKLTIDVLTILRGYFAAGKPQANLTPFGSYEGWSEVVRGAVYWATGLDPVATRGVIRDNDPATLTRAAVVAAWAQLPDGQTEGITVAEALRLLRDQPENYKALRDAIMPWSRNDKLPTEKDVGNRLRSIRGRIANGRAMLGEPNRNGVIKWRAGVPSLVSEQAATDPQG
jgi:hypothetical protein